jgi:hypothetical protein
MAIKANRMSYLQPYRCVSDFGEFFGLGRKLDDGNIQVAAFRYGMNEATIKSIENQHARWFLYILIIIPPDDEHLYPVTDPNPQALQFMELVRIAREYLGNASVVNTFSIDEESFSLLISSWQPNWSIEASSHAVLINGYPVDVKQPLWGKAVFKTPRHLVVWTHDDKVHMVEWASDTGRYLQASILGRFDFDGDIGNPDLSVIASILGAAT